ncbi:MAG: hypothetical protein WC824_07955 [Bacteroidota bacterium]
MIDRSTPEYRRAFLKASKAIILAPWLKAAGEIPETKNLEEASLELMDWPEEKIDDLLSSLGIVVTVPEKLDAEGYLQSELINTYELRSEEREQNVVETALVFDKEGKTLLWHVPAGRSGGGIPDSHDLWEFLWENRKIIGGVAHTHPWNGEAWFSQTDVTTWAAIEQGLGIRLVWPVVTMTEMKQFSWVGPEKLDYELRIPHVPVDVNGLRERSKEGA